MLRYYLGNLRVGLTWQSCGLGPSAASPQKIPAVAVAIVACYDTAAATNSDPAICKRN